MRRKAARVRLESDERRAQLLALGLRAFSTRGYADVSVDDLAREAGISKGLLYHYFPTKRDFYVAALRLASKDLLARALDVDSTVPLVRLQRGLDAFLAYVDEHAPAVQALFRGGLGADPEVAAVVEETRQAFLTVILREAGSAPPLLEIALRGWVGAVESASLEWVTRREASAVEVRDLLIQMLMSIVQRWL
jgi:AcrR family transcriptional regulator